MRFLKSPQPCLTAGIPDSTESTEPKFSRNPFLGSKFLTKKAASFSLDINGLTTTKRNQTNMNAAKRNIPNDNPIATFASLNNLKMVGKKSTMACRIEPIMLNISISEVS